METSFRPPRMKLSASFRLVAGWISVGFASYHSRRRSWNFESSARQTLPAGADYYWRTKTMAGGTTGVASTPQPVTLNRRTSPHKGDGAQHPPKRPGPAG